MMKKYLVVVLFLFLVVSRLSYFDSEVDMNESSSLIGLTIDGVESTTFPAPDSGYAIDSILCDKGANGVWDYTNWTLKVRNITGSRTKCQINFVSKYHENILNGTDPVLNSGMIPVIIENDGVVKKASLGWEWYDYETSVWANAVILNDESEVYYDGDVIPEDAIESYFVWIPRYKYQIFNEGNYSTHSAIENKIQIIRVAFENKDTPKSTGSTVGSWLTHPAFTSFETNGMWVGKFETGYKGANATIEAEKNENNPSKIQIKPNVYSWRNINVANAYLSSYAYQREYNSHLIKNTEWGAVGYLSYSEYGRGNKDVFTNNNSSYKTGYGSFHELTTGYTGTNIPCSTNKDACNEYGVDEMITRSWNTEYGFRASTTGNISGVYDMGGGAQEYVMGVMLSSDNQTPCSGLDEESNSGFNGPYCRTNDKKTDGVPFPTDSRYFDTYAYGTTDGEYHRRILGDATGEMGPFAFVLYDSLNRKIGSWYDEAWFVRSNVPWFFRGGAYKDGIGAGIGAFGNAGGTCGQAVSGLSYRIVLAI